jgi:hypothetical protein
LKRATPARFTTQVIDRKAGITGKTGLLGGRTTIKVEKIKEDQDYEGLRVTFTGYMEAARLPVQIDIGFGDAVTPDPIETDFPTLLESPAPRLLSYPRETVIAEKLEAIVKLGIANTRMKDFHDLKTLSELFQFDRCLDRRANHVNGQQRPILPRSRHLGTNPNLDVDESVMPAPD